MTDHQVQPEPELRPAPRRRPKALPTVLAAVAVFAVAFEFLAFQLSSGRDPAIGGATGAVTRQAVARPVNKRIVITRVIDSRTGASGMTSAGSVAPSGASTIAAAAPAPITTATS
jgi:hypothetical protein